MFLIDDILLNEIWERPKIGTWGVPLYVSVPLPELHDWIMLETRVLNMWMASSSSRKTRPMLSFEKMSHMFRKCIKIIIKKKNEHSSMYTTTI